MDSPQLLHLALLLLALAAPRPNIATSIVSPTEGTEDSSTEMKLYRCKDCGSCICMHDAIDFGKYRMIADSQSKSSSEVSIKLMTNKRHTTVCFEEENSCLNETYGIYWERDGRPGLACGILSSGGNPEFLTSKKNSTGILFAVLFVGVCAGWGTMYYCLRLRRRGQAFRQCRQDSECGIVSLVREPSTREETPLTAASSSLSECTATS